MMIEMHFSSSHIKKLNVVQLEHTKGILKIDENLDSMVLKELAGRHMALKFPEKKFPDRDNKRTGRFKDWRMPVQSEGYIKAKKHGLL